MFSKVGMVLICIAMMLGDSDKLLLPTVLVLIGGVLILLGKMTEVRHEEAKADR